MKLFLSIYQDLDDYYAVRTKTINMIFNRNVIDYKSVIKIMKLFIRVFKIFSRVNHLKKSFLASRP